MIIYQEKDLRISLITPRLLRTEKGAFCDLPTQIVQKRDFGDVKYTLEEEKKYIFVQTQEAGFKVRKSDGKVVYASMPPYCYARNFTKHLLPGTARTLDMANGSVKLKKGIISRYGTTLLDDSKSLVINNNGTISSRAKCKDRYWFAYGQNYLEQLKDFFSLTGKVPLIPKYALGNWWSRYKAYTQEEYRTLMKEFINREIPITVATIDMDWHWTDVINRFGEEARCEKPKCPEEIIYYHFLQGWTGYSWNTELFPDYKELLNWLHENGFKITLNVHPSQGVRFFEDAYTEMCKKLGKNPEDKEIISFDVTNPEFMRAYFEVLHNPLENDGVDFWWIDWQQGKRSKIEGLDPLWALNHYHTQNADRGEKRPLILSRYSGLGSHRYPLGFSGDTIVTWKSLDFQPYFTNCAANAGYTWWSHDIGGHMKGIQDDELYLRWLQYGVFSPINRLHSSNSDYMGKEPWKRSYAVNKISEDFLRLRHKLIPYLYSANYRTHTYGEPICMPMYYRYNSPDAYKVKNQYIFGGQLMVCPITKPQDKRLNLSNVDVWLPEGRWTDIFNGRIYQGGRWVKMYRDLDSIPVLAKEGAIVPMYKNDRTNDLSLNHPLEIHVWRGNGTYELYDDDGETKAYQNGEYSLTKFALEESDNSLKLTITPPENLLDFMPKQREFIIKFRDLEVDDMTVIVSDKPITIELESPAYKTNDNPSELKNAILTRVQKPNMWKSKAFKNKYPRFVQNALNEIDAL